MAQKPPKAKKGEPPPEPKKVGVIRFGLAAVRGVGEKAVDSISAERTKNGPFKKIEELMNVQGIGEKSFLKLRPQITVAGKSDSGRSQQ